MSEYNIDRFRLESMPTSEIRSILRDQRDDYTPEAIEVLEDILRNRGIDPEGGTTPEGAPALEYRESGGLSGETLVLEPGHAVPVLNNVLNGVLNGTIDPEVGQAASNIVLVILQALERQFMTDTGEEIGSG